MADPVNRTILDDTEIGTDPGIGSTSRMVLAPKIDEEDHPFGNRSLVSVDLVTLNEAAGSRR